MVGSFPLDGGDLPIGKICFQPMVCCKDIQYHIEDQQALHCEQKKFLRSLPMSKSSSILSLDDHRASFRFNFIPSQALGSDQI
jgi:hypothetical protein